MVNIRPDRMRSVTDARNAFSVLVGEAESGLTTHIVKGSTVVAHLVPATVPILDDRVALEMMLTAVIKEQVIWASPVEQWPDGQLNHVGDTLGRILGWAWITDPDRLFMKFIVDYVRRLSLVVGRPLTLQDIRLAMLRGLGGGLLGDSEVAAAFAYAEQHWDQWALP
jgi:antitoxin (DNA-binding transcriptional repressor) of toxin-antitoxin stability system